MNGYGPDKAGFAPLESVRSPATPSRCDAREARRGGEGAGGGVIQQGGAASDLERQARQITTL